MENQLTNKVLTIDSKEVAEMMGKSHKDLLDYINGKTDKNGVVQVVGIKEVLEKEGLPFNSYFIESSYKPEGAKRSYQCYLCTKKGCELLGNKQQGAKGILFTAKYVERFNEMEQQISQQMVLSQNEIIKLKQEMQNMFTIFNDSMTNMANSFQSQLQDSMKLVQATTVTASEQLLKAKSQYKPSHKRKLEYNKLIKQLSNSEDDVELIKVMVLNKFNASKWEDICTDDDETIINEIYNIASKFTEIRTGQKIEREEQIEVYPKPTPDNTINYFEYLFGGDKPIYKKSVNRVLVPKKTN